MSDDQSPTNPLYAPPSEANANDWNCVKAQRRVSVHLSRVATVLSGQNEGKGRAIKKLVVDQGAPCATDGETVWLTYPIMKDLSPTENLIITEAILAHEAAGHLRYTNFNAWKRVCDLIKKGEEDKLLHDFVNIVEDARVNYLLGQDFAGSKKRLDYAQRKMMAGHRAKVEGRVIEDKEAPMMGVIAIATEVIMGEAHFVNHPKVIAMMDEMRPLFGDAIASQDTSRVVKKCRELLTIYRIHFPEDETMGTEHGATESESGEGLFADDMSQEKVCEAANKQKSMKAQAESVRTNRFKKLKLADEGRDMPEKGEGDQGMGDSTQEGSEAQDGEGEGEGGEGGETDGEGDEVTDGCSSKGQGTGEGDEEGDEGDQGTKLGDGNSTSASTDSDTYTAPTEEEGVGRGAVGSADALTGEGTADVNLETEFDSILEDAMSMEDWVVDAVENGDDVRIAEEACEYGGGMDRDHAIIVSQMEDHEREGVERYNTVSRTNRAGAKRIGKVVKNLVKGADTRFNTHRKKGKLDTRRLWAHSTSERIFKKDAEAKDFKAAVVVLIDASGSMGCNVSSESDTGRTINKTRACLAGEAAVTISESLEEIDATYEVVDFMSSYGNCSYSDIETTARLGATKITMRKAANESLNNKTKSKIVTAHIGGENADGFALKWAIERTKKIATDGEKRIVFVISDGAPAGPSPAGMGAGRHLKYELTEAMDDDVIIFSVGIAGMDTSAYYGDHGWATVTNTANLAQDILMPLKTCLKKAMRA